MEYIVSTKGSKKAHIWNKTKNDTACTMYSTGGLSKKYKYKRFEVLRDREVCKMCLNNHRKYPTQSEP